MAATEQTFFAQPVVSAAGRVIASPFQFYTTGEDRLRVVSANSLTGVVLAIQSRFVDTTGLVQANSWSHTPNTDRTVKHDDFELGVGALLNLTIFASSGAPLVGQTFVIVQLVRGMGAAAIVLGTLLQGYVTSTQQLAWPGSPIVSSTEGEPVVRQILGTIPAIGQDINEVVPTGARWELLALRAPLATSNNAASRFVRLVYRLGPTAWMVALQSQAAGPSITGDYTFAPGLGNTADAGPLTFNAPVPIGARLIGGTQIQTATLNLQPGDQWQAPIYVVREWLEVP